MAGAGAKKFPAFSKLSSADVNDYLADQVIMRFATTAARDAAFGGVGEPTLAEGMTAYIDADNSIYTYDGSNWVKMVSASTPVGLELIKTVTIGTTVTSVPVINCFSNDFQSYRVIISGVLVSGSGNSSFIKLNNSTGSTYYSSGYFATFPATGLTGAAVPGNEGLWLGIHGGTYSAACDIHNPNQTIPTTFGGGSVAGASSGFSNKFDGVDTNPVAQTGFNLNIATGSPHTMTGGTIRVYGYRN